MEHGRASIRCYFKKIFGNDLERLLSSNFVVSYDEWNSRRLYGGREGNWERKGGGLTTLTAYIWGWIFFFIESPNCVKGTHCHVWEFLTREHTQRRECGRPRGEKSGERDGVLWSCQQPLWVSHSTSLSPLLFHCHAQNRYICRGRPPQHGFPTGISKYCLLSSRAGQREKGLSLHTALGTQFSDWGPNLPLIPWTIISMKNVSVIIPTDWPNALFFIFTFLTF